MDKDELEGNARQGMGEATDKAGEMLGNDDMQAQGQAGKAEGETQESVGKFKGMLHSIKEKITR